MSSFEWKYTYYSSSKALVSFVDIWAIVHGEGSLNYQKLRL